MAVLTRPLSASEVQKAKPANKDYELSDGQRLILFIRTNGKKSGVFVTNASVRQKLEQEEAERERLGVDSLFINLPTRW
ncbi:hypothetical protein [Brenneria salicis]|uniref:Uncharacterized protein n=1 Tax=Brenneria salicis ATCC 15712 = DSM 30166 TaxID=714314 RepID=A0A366ICK2_9GAMM|nr:hypothetical protein [Brenneria salicis]RBP67524.1 hypothetical protein DES54_10136 [Brenneria salicis ATCC 15712 = DSM 30166]RLM32488.1 hypothetical protein BHG07_01320 [Brenneria salicis ATCC 15712 = DSM 30166]